MTSDIIIIFTIIIVIALKMYIIWFKHNSPAKFVIPETADAFVSAEVNLSICYHNHYHHCYHIIIIIIIVIISLSLSLSYHQSEIIIIISAEINRQVEPRVLREEKRKLN